MSGHLASFPTRGAVLAVRITPCDGIFWNVDLSKKKVHQYVTGSGCLTSLGSFESWGLGV